MKCRRPIACRFYWLTVCAALLLMGLRVDTLRAESPTGEQIYVKQCASCHGKEGEGTKEHSEPLVGDLTLMGLAKFIDREMPEEKAKECAGPDAEKVAKYVYDTFYSAIAQARRNPARIELSRLTVRQYENSVSDLVGGFRSPSVWDAERGLKTEYFNSGRSIREDKRVVERREDQIQFDGNIADIKNLSKEEYAIRWSGGVFAPETGDYEFTLKGRNGARLWINRANEPRIDAWVRSGDETNEKVTVRLLGGRVYPIRVEFFKAKKEKAASIEIRWKPPHRVDEVIGRRYLSPHKQPERFVVETKFPPDDASWGYERGNLISKEWDRATTDAALEVAAYVGRHLGPLAGYRDKDADRDKKIRAFCAKFAERALRRPLADDEKRFYIDQQFAGAKDPVTGAKRAVLLALKSPRFLYHGLNAEGHIDHEIAARVSFALWDSLPDERLRAAAARGQLHTRQHVEHQIRRMLADGRTRAKLRDFLHRWLDLERTHTVVKDKDAFPDFSNAVLADLRVSLDLFLDDVVWSDASDYRRLLSDRSMYVNGRLAKFYGIELDENADFQKVELKKQVRTGVLSHPLLMAGFAYGSTSSPIHRGVFIVRQLLGRTLHPPAEAVVPLAPDLHPKMTTRERVELQTQAKACMSCHRMINPLGFSLENYDAVGRFRTEEKGRPVDASSQLLSRSGDIVKFRGAKELATFLADSSEAHMAFVDQLFHYTIKQPIRAYGPKTRESLRDSFADNDYHMRELLVDVVITAALHQPSKK